MDTKVVSSLFFCIFAFCLAAGDVCPKFDPGIGQGYLPGTPGASWTTEEILIVKEKVMVMIHPDNTNLYDDRTRFPPIVNRVYGDGDVWNENPNNVADSSGIFYNRQFPRSNDDLSPSSRKLVRLAFHDCLRSTDAQGNLSGGCDGCLNWTGMDWLNELPLCNMAFSYPWWPSYRSEPVQHKTDNNKLSTTVMALQWIYMDPTWPPGAKNLSSSLWSTGKSRADLWQLAANTALEVEIARANYGCSNKASYQQMVLALEGMDKCLWKLHKPIPFQYGRADCVNNHEQAQTGCPFEATDTENHFNHNGLASTVLEGLRDDFGLSARQSIALMASHGIKRPSHDKVMGMTYTWAGNPFISNLYFKTLAGVPQFDLGIGLWAEGIAYNPWGGGLGVLVGDKWGRPLDRQMQGKFALHMNDWWNTSLPDSGPWFFRPMTVDSTAGYEEDLLPRQPCFHWNTTTKEYQRLSPDLSPQCWLTEVSINETTGVQYGGPPLTVKQASSFTFFLPYEMNFVMDFDVDEENRPRGCNIPLVYGDSWFEDYGSLQIDCPRQTFVLLGENQTTADIVEEFAEDHELWARDFLEGWQVTPSSPK